MWDTDLSYEDQLLFYAEAPRGESLHLSVQYFGDTQLNAS